MRKKLPPIPVLMRNWRFWLIAALITGIAWRLLDYFLRFPIWGDEASLGMNIIQRNYLQLLQPLGRVQVCPIGFLWLSKFMISVAGTSTLTLRFFPLLAGIGATLLLALICMALDIHSPWVGPGPRLVRNLTAAIFAHAGKTTQIVITNKHPDAYASEIAWYLNTRSHIYQTGVILTPKIIHASTRHLWVIHFGYKMVRHFNHRIQNDLQAANGVLTFIKMHDRIMRVGFSGNPPVIAQAFLFSIKGP